MSLTKISLWIGIFVGMFALVGGTLTIIWQVSPFASKEAQAAAEIQLNRHEVDIQVMKASIPGIDHKVDRLDQKIDLLNDTWNKHILLEHRR
jgi:hypothetical protein